MENETAPTSSGNANSGGKSTKLILIIVVLAIVVFGGGVFAYGKFVKKANSLGEILTPTKFNPNCKYNDPDLCKFMNNWKDVKSFTMTSVSTDKDNKRSEFIMKSENDTNSQMTSSENGKENYNYIVIGDTSYTKDYTDNKWFKYTLKKDQNTEFGVEESKLEFDDKADSTEDNTIYKKIGTEACGKLTCFKYQVIDPAMTDTTQYIYFDNKEYVLRKTRDEGKDGSITESTFDYGKVSISAPSPTKDGNPYDFSTTTTTPSAEELQNQINAANAASASSSTVPTEEPAYSPTPDENVSSETYPTEEEPVE